MSQSGRMSILKLKLGKGIGRREKFIAIDLKLAIKRVTNWLSLNLKKNPFEPHHSSGPLVICANHYPQEIARSLTNAGFKNGISGVFYLNSNVEDNTGQYPLIKDIEDALNLIVSGKIEDIVFIENLDSDPLSKDTREALLPELLTLPIRIWLAVNVEREFSVIFKHKQANYKLLKIVGDDLIHSQNRGKRVFDIIVGSTLLAVLLPVLLSVAMLVRISSPGPVIFRQKRTGAQGKVFEVLKFRTMIFCPQGNLIQATPDDPRVTKIGRFLRRTSLDELLQLINVVKGDMSLVGPRPHAIETKVQGVPFYNAIKFYRGRYRVKPGITGLAQIRGLRGETKFIEKLEERVLSDLEYIERWSIWLDISIILRTLPIFFTQKNAY